MVVSRYRRIDMFTSQVNRHTKKKRKEAFVCDALRLSKSACTRSMRMSNYDYAYAYAYLCVGDLVG